MCGIFAIFNPKGVQKYDLNVAKSLSSRQSHRGPDFSGYWQNSTTGTILCHERLAIVDLRCHQPIQGLKSDHMVIHNGEIYNHQALRSAELHDYELKTTCDSEVIIYLYEKYRSNSNDFESVICNKLDGVFAFAISYEDEFLVARDPIGVKPLYYGMDSEGRYFFSSEMKVFEDIKSELKTFPPGHFFSSRLGDRFIRYFNPSWLDIKSPTAPPDLNRLRDSLISAAEKRLMSDVPIGVLLSGGLDSSLVSAIATRKMKKLGLTVHSFSIGLDENAPDLAAARKTAKFLGTKHHEFHFSVAEGISVIEKLIWHLETYDVTTIRASTPMYLLSKKIYEMGIKVVLSGEGADEIFGGYLYFHNAPSDEEFRKETITRVEMLSTADCLRADKSCMANHLEVRVPFLDKSFLEVAMSITPEFKRPGGENQRIEKWVLRKAFEEQEKENAFIPTEILWRQKEQFSDGVGYGWIDSLMEHCSSMVSDEEMEKAPTTFPYNSPVTKEAYYIRKIFSKHFKSRSAAMTVSRWIPKWQSSADPSGRASAFHHTSGVLKNGKSDGVPIE